ncbi:hypothetical protein LTR36_001702 [Oleoguttula mirabilis]|uniref:adenosine deaminase n=1 Tax=Oleoguttula mirabilis TaxID=1507867 RepID=A0AAV9JNU7_9PEZI|nr:hypothetical protein LTR36_001702 [Oleoguttula mirabilis]
MPDVEAARDLLVENIKLAEDSIDYRGNRGELLSAERGCAWDANAKSRASRAELQAQDVVFKIRENERIDPTLFGNLPSEAVPDPRTRDMGGRFLVNKSAIERSKILGIAKGMPKGSHLHLHFNSEIPPEMLFPHARNLHETMFIRTTKPLCTRADFDDAEMVFNVLPKETYKADCFSAMYNPDAKDKNNSPWMLWTDFRNYFPADMVFENTEGLENAEYWAQNKMIIAADNGWQTHNGAWACFNQGTRAFKGLLNYEGVYRWYIGHAIDSMIKDKVMFAELRPMLLDKTIPSDDGTRQLDHKDQMNIICEEVQNKHKELEKAGDLDKFPFGVKIIYCTPRSIPKQRMQIELQDCIKLKLQFPDLICGFDLVGAEDRPNHVGFYADLLVGFTKTCKTLGISIPFMFHAGETLLDTGGSSNPDNSNLYDALLLNAKRIGHGYSLLKHPMLVERYKKQNICLELCPISNELLHLCGNAREHPFPGLLAAGLHCTLNADNPSLFRGPTLDSSSLSHEFYQVMVGDTRMTIHGWKQLAEWSLEHSCLTEAELKQAMEIFGRDWEVFCQWVVETYGEYADGLPDLQ